MGGAIQDPSHRRTEQKDVAQDDPGLRPGPIKGADTRRARLGGLERSRSLIHIGLYVGRKELAYRVVGADELSYDEVGR